jgi:uncharacterized protein
VGRKIYLAFEFLLVFAGIPLLLAFRLIPIRPIPLLGAVAVASTLWLWRDRRFNNLWLLNQEGARRHWRAVVVRTLLLVTLLGVTVAAFAPHLLFQFVHSAPLVWAMLMVLYPLLSVIPQELVFRAFLFHRYAALFGSPGVLVTASATAFAFAHIVMGNWISVVLSAFGGILFARTYQQSRSLLLVSAEHALFGNFIFTVGLGEYFLSRG